MAQGTTNVDSPRDTGGKLSREWRWGCSGVRWTSAGAGPAFGPGTRCYAYSVMVKARGSRLASACLVAVPMMLWVAACGAPSSELRLRDARIAELERHQQEMRGAYERQVALLDSLRASMDELLRNLDEARSARDAAQADRDVLAAQLETSRLRVAELEEQRAGASSDISRARESASEARARVEALEQELEEVQGRERQLRRRAETLRVCCRSAEP